MLDDYLDGNPDTWDKLCGVDCDYNYYNASFRAVHDVSMKNIANLERDGWTVVALWEHEYQEGKLLPDGVSFE